MNIKIITVGKLKEKYLRDGVQEYVKRLGAYAHVDLIEVPDEKRYLITLHLQKRHL